MDDRQTQVLLDEVDAVRDELSQLQTRRNSHHRMESRARRLLPVVFALVAGLTAWYAVRVAMAGQSDAVTVTLPRARMIPVAITHLEPGMVVRVEDLGFAPLDEIEDVAVGILLKEHVIVGRTVRTAIEPGNPIHARQLGRPSSGRSDVAFSDFSHIVTKGCDGITSTDPE